MTDPNETQVGGDHYKKYPIQPWDLLIDDNIPWAEGCIIEYVIRWRDKGGIQDLEKARHLIDKIIAKNDGIEPIKSKPCRIDALRNIMPMYPPPCDCERCSEE